MANKYLESNFHHDIELVGDVVHKISVGWVQWRGASSILRYHIVLCEKYWVAVH